MEFSQDQAIKLASDYLHRLIEEKLTDHFQGCEVRDSFPKGRACYLPGNTDDYWYVEMPLLFEEKSLQVGGGSKYLAICKITGTVSIISTLGE
jgi:hypothetical protein